MTTQTQTTHTPGPWLNPAGVRQYQTPEGVTYHAAVGSRRDANGRLLDILVSRPNPDAEDIANLQLAATAPDLLAALKDMMNTYAYDFEQDEKNLDEDELAEVRATWDFAEAAIQKAEGT